MFLVFPNLGRGYCHSHFADEETESTSHSWQVTEQGFEFSRLSPGPVPSLHSGLPPKSSGTSSAAIRPAVVRPAVIQAPDSLVLSHRLAQLDFSIRGTTVHAMGYPTDQHLVQQGTHDAMSSVLLTAKLSYVQFQHLRICALRTGRSGMGRHTC